MATIYSTLFRNTSDQVYKCVSQSLFGFEIFTVTLKNFREDILNTKLYWQHLELIQRLFEVGSVIVCIKYRINRQERHLRFFAFLLSSASKGSSLVMLLTFSWCYRQTISCGLLSDYFRTSGGFYGPNRSWLMVMPSRIKIKD